MAAVFDYPGVTHLNDDSERICRFCHDNVEQGLISPCNCRGSIRWVHRECLDHWRAVSPNPESLSTCDNCKTKYKVIIKNEERPCARAKFVALVARDIIFVIVLVNLIIAGLGFLADLIIPADKIVKHLTGLAWLMEHRLVRVYCWGGIVFFFFMGIIGIIFSFYRCCCAKSEDEAESHVSASSYAGYHSSTYDCYFIYCGPYYNPTYGYYYGPCGNWSCDCCTVCCDCSCGCSGGELAGGNCSGGSDNCNCDSGGEGGAVLLVIALVIVAVIVLLGLFFGVFLFTLVASKIVHRHIHVLDRSHKAQLMYVANLADPAEASLATEFHEERYEDVVPLLSGESIDLEPKDGQPIPVGHKKLADDDDDEHHAHSVV